MATQGLGPGHDEGTRLSSDVVTTPAAVLVPLVDRPGGLTLLFTRRTEHLHHHGGQICFPGGRMEEGDGGVIDTALRETAEEIGLDIRRIQVIGRLDDYRTITGFLVTPIVGILEPPFELAPDTFEVAEVFEMPLSYLLDPANHQRITVKGSDPPRSAYAVTYEGRVIWGATAGMLMNLYRILRGGA
ncbi:MAG: CoA pyrophosphatase [Alphaproteobacteria bacterium]